MVWGPAGSSISLGGDTNLGIQYATITLANSADTIQYAFSSTGSQSGSAWITGNAANWVTGSGTTLTLDLSYANTNLTEAIWDNAATPDTIYLFVKESNGGAIASQPLSRVPVSSLALLDYSPNDVTAFTPVTLVQSYNLVTYSLPAIGTLFQVTDVISTNQLVSGTGISVAAVWAPYSTTSSYSTNTLDITNKPNWGTGNSYGWINVSGMTGTPGFTPNLNSVSNGAIQVGIRLFSAISNHLLPSAIINYTIAFQYAPPVITSSIGGSLHSDGNLEVTVTISTPTNSYVFYTLDGSTPYEGSLKYSGPFLLRSPATITPILIAYDNGSYWNSGNPLTLSTQHTALGEATSVTLAEIGNSDMQLGMINIYFGQPIDSSAQASIATGGMMTLAVSGTSPNAPVGSIKLNAGIPGGFPGGTGLSPYWNVVDTLGGYRNANKTPLRDIFGSGNSNNSITVSPYYNTFTSTGMPGIYYNTSGVSIPTIASALSSPASTSTLAEVSNLPSANYLLIATIISGVGVTKPNNVTLNLDALTGATCLTNLQDPTCPSFINIGAPANLYGVLPASVTPDSAWTVTAMITPDNSGEPISFSLLGNNIVTLQIIKVVEFLQPALNQAVTTGTGTSAVTTYSMAGTLQVPTSTGGNYCLMYLHGSIYSTAYPNSFINDGYELLYTNDNTNYQIDINTGGENDTSPIINNRTTSYAGNITYFYGNQYFFEADPSSLIQLGWVPPSDLRVGQILNTLTVAPPASGFTTTLPYGVSYLSQNLGSNYTSLSVAAPYSGCLIPPVFALISMDAVLNTGIYARYNLYPPVIVPTKRNASTYSPTATIFSYNSEGPALCVTTNSSTPLVQPATPAIGNTVGGGTISIGTTPTIIKAAMISTATGYYYDIPAMEFTNEFTNNDVYVVTTGSDESLYVNYTLVAAPDTTAAFTYNTGDVVTLKSSSTSVTTTIKQLIGDLIPAGQAYPASKSYTQELTSYPSVTTTLVTGFSNNASVSSFTVSSETVAAAIWAGGTSYVFVTGMGIPAGVHVTSISGTTIHVGVLTNADNPFTATAASTGSYVFSTAYMAHLSQYESLSCNALVLNPGTEYATGIENRTLTPGFGTQVFTFSVPTNAPITITTTNGDTSVQSSIWVSQVPTFDYLHWNTGPVSPSLYIGCNGSLNSYDFCNPPGTGNAPDAAPVQSAGTGSYLNVYYYLSAAGQTITMLNGIEGIQSQNPMYFFCTDVAPGANAISGTNGALLAGAIYGAGEYDIGSQDEVYGQPCTAQYQITGLVTGANYYISVAENETLYYYYYSATDSSSWPTGTSGTTNILLGVSGLPAGAVFILQSNTVNAPIHSFIYEITDSGKLDKGISYKGISPTSISLPTTYTDADSTSVSPVTSIQYT
jgi:hypothetical protein